MKMIEFYILAYWLLISKQVVLEIIKNLVPGVFVNKKSFLVQKNKKISPDHFIR